MSHAVPAQGRMGAWPDPKSGPIPRTQGESWATVDRALYAVLRGLPGGSPLPRLLAQHRGRPNPGARPRLTESQILHWADRHRARTGRWPRFGSGRVRDARDETWAAVEHALREGLRGLPGGYTLAALLDDRRRSRGPRPKHLTLQQVQIWAEVHRRRTGRWPTGQSGSVPRTGGLTWREVEQALHAGRSGLPRGLSLAQLATLHTRSV